MSAVVHITSLYYYNYLFINERTFMVTIMLHVYWLEECTDCCHDAHIAGNYQHIYTGHQLLATTQTVISRDHDHILYSTYKYTVKR